MKRVFLNRKFEVKELSAMVVCRHETEAGILIKHLKSINIPVLYDHDWGSASINLIERYRARLPLPDVIIMASKEYVAVKEKMNTLFLEFGIATPPVIAIEDSSEGKLDLIKYGIAGTMNTWEFKIPTRVLPKILEACQLREDNTAD